jgi:hypothetical protein
MNRLLTNARHYSGIKVDIGAQDLARRPGEKILRKGWMACVSAWSSELQDRTSRPIKTNFFGL